MYVPYIAPAPPLAPFTPRLRRRLRLRCHRPAISCRYTWCCSHKRAATSTARLRQSVNTAAGVAPSLGRRRSRSRARSTQRSLKPAALGSRATFVFCSSSCQHLRLRAAFHGTHGSAVNVCVCWSDWINKIQQNIHTKNFYKTTITMLKRTH